MRKIFIIAAFCAAITGCGQEQAPVQSEVQQAMEAAAVSPAHERMTVSVEPLQSGAAITVGGQGIVFPFEHVLRYDRIGVTSKSQRKQRQAFFEVKGADAASVITQVTDAMVAAGYRAGRSVEDKGGQRISFRKKNALPVSVLVRPRTERPKLKDPAATASVYLAITEKLTD